jgi:hypothetical protein
VATLGQQAKVFSADIYALIIGISLLASMIAPPVLKYLLDGLPAEPAGEEDEEMSHLYAVEATGHGPNDPE